MATNRANERMAGFLTSNANQPSPWPLSGRLAALDYGSVRVGVAITDPDQRFVSPLENYTRRNEQLDLAWLKQLVEQERVVGLIVGLPVHLSGNESEKSREVRQFVAWLQPHMSVPILLFDERFTTSQADELLAEAGFTSKQRKERRDKLAAYVLLLSYLESSRDATKPSALDDRT
jgi:putative Holliday junction resolvase